MKCITFLSIPMFLDYKVTFFQFLSARISRQNVLWQSREINSGIQELILLSDRLDRKSDIDKLSIFMTTSMLKQEQ